MSLLPAYMSELWRCYEQMSREDLQSFDIDVVSRSADSCHSVILPFLAWECDTDISGLDEKTARAVIISAFDAMQYAGTVKALIGTIESVSESAKIMEWFEYAGNPYNFKIDINVKNMSVDEATIVHLENLVLKKKNSRSMLESITVNLTSISKLSAAMYFQTGEIATLYPYQLTEIEFNPVSNKNLSALQSIETLYIYPQGE